MMAGIASPAPPVGHPPVPRGLGNAAVPTGNEALDTIPFKSPVEAITEAYNPAEKYWPTTEKSQRTHHSTRYV